MTGARIALFVACCLAGSAQALPPGSIRAEISNDERRRGISWSDGKPSASVRLRASAGALALDARATALRGSARQGSADAVIDGTARYRIERGALRFDLGGVVHGFAGGSGPRDYGELTAETALLVGPADLALFADYAPRQRAIGGDNLHLGAAASVAIVGTPLTVGGQIGRSSGTVRDPARAARLRPGGSYSDWQVGVTATRGFLSLSTSLSGTSGTGGARHADERLVIRLAASL